MQEGIGFGGPMCFHNAGTSALPLLLQLHQYRAVAHSVD